MTEECSPAELVTLAETVARWEVVEEIDNTGSIARARSAIAEARELREKVMPAGGEDK